MSIVASPRSRAAASMSERSIFEKSTSTPCLRNSSFSFGPKISGNIPASRTPLRASASGTRMFTLRAGWPSRAALSIVMRIQRGGTRDPSSIGAVSLTARRSCSASSTVTFPWDSSSRTRLVSLVVSVVIIIASHARDGVARRNLAPFQLQEHLAGRPPWRCRRLDLRKREPFANPIEPVLDGGIADAEQLLHVFDGSVAANERRHEDLVFGWKLRERREVERPFDSDARLFQTDPLDGNRLSVSEFC